MRTRTHSFSWPRGQARREHRGAAARVRAYAVRHLEQLEQPSTRPVASQWWSTTGREVFALTLLALAVQPTPSR